MSSVKYSVEICSEALSASVIGTNTLSKKITKLPVSEGCCTGSMPQNGAGNDLLGASYLYKTYRARKICWYLSILNPN